LFPLFNKLNTFVEEWSFVGEWDGFELVKEHESKLIIEFGNHTVSSFDDPADPELSVND